MQMKGDVEHVHLKLVQSSLKTGVVLRGEQRRC